MAAVTNLVRFTPGQAPAEAIYANHIGYSDVDPYEVVEIRTAKKLLVRAMDTKLDPAWKRDFHPGGFFGHTANDRDQRWFITPDTNAPIFPIRQHKNGKWYDNHGGRYALSDQPTKFYDHNF